MELRQLKYFLAVADARSFANAATSLYISRQAVSKAISQLEAEMGVELFVRDSGGAFLTPAGVLFYDRIRSNVMELDQARNHLQNYGKRYQQHIRIACSVGLIPLYEEALQGFMREQKNLALNYWECPEEQCMELLRERKADMVLCTGKPQAQDLDVTLLSQSPYGVLLQNTENLRYTHSLNLEDLSWLPLAGIADGANQAFCKAHHLTLGYAGLDFYRLFSLTKAGQCAMLLPECQKPAELSGLRWIPLEQVESWALYCVCLKSLENNILYRTTIDELQSQIFSPEVSLERSPTL